MPRILINFTDEEYSSILKAAKVALSSRRGVSSKSRRIRKKIFKEGVLKAITDIAYNKGENNG